MIFKFQITIFNATFIVCNLVQCGYSTLQHYSFNLSILSHTTSIQPMCPNFFTNLTTDFGQTNKKIITYAESHYDRIIRLKVNCA